MNIRWFLPGLIGFLCIASPAVAGELASWRFDPTENSLEFATDEGVQPRAQLVPDPTRLVIDLPGTVIGEVQRSQLLTGAFRQIRIGQWDANTTRIVVELTPGYTLDPQQVRFRGISPTQWTVQLPSPEYTGVTATPQMAVPQTTTPQPVTSSETATSTPSVPYPLSPSSGAASHSSTSVVPSPIAPAPPASPSRSSTDTFPNSLTSASATVDDSVTQIELMQVTDDGLFLRTAGATPEIDRVRRSRDRRSITITLENTILSPQLTQETTIEQFGVSRLQFTQVEQDDDDDPPTVEITLEIDRDSPNWNATVSGLGGIVLLPQERVTQRSRDRSSESQNVVSNSTSEEESAPSSHTVSALPVATIEGIDLDPSGTQLLIHSDRPVTYTGQWQSGMYQVRLSPAHLAAQVTGPELDANSPLLRVRLRQEDDETVVVMIQPASGVRFGSLNSVSPQLLSLEMEQSRSTPTSRSVLPATATNQTFQQSDSSSFSTTGAASGQTPGVSGSRIPNGQIVIVIDPGHGGVDVGAVGIGNIHEADVVLPVAQQVGALLQQQGIQVVMTRNDDREIDLEPRVQMAEQANATLFVSIHANSMGMDRPDVNGTETYYYSNGAGLAQVIQDSIVGALDMNDRGIKQARFYVLRRTTMPAVLVEIGYVTGSEDGRRLGDSNFQSQMARAIAQGILQYIQSMASH